MVGRLRIIGLLWLAGLVLLAGCSFTSREVSDGGPARPVDVSHIPDAVPREEVRGPAGNKSPYTVMGKTYWVMEDSTGFTQEGVASWYGTKFHGRQTSNGELYSMYGMTAAHKTLPIPSYVRVTNLQNGRQVVVRVNDRGPFLHDRIIDLTYAGASKLGFLKHGTAPVRIEVVEPGQNIGTATAAATTMATATAIAQPQPQPTVLASRNEELPAPEYAAGYKLPANTFLQAGAFASPSAAESVRQRIAGLTSLPVFVSAPRKDKLYRVRIGPIADNLALMDIRQQLERNEMPAPHIIYD
ncbi:MAG: septal ring lytic transglycosylase RlpA family protein [Gammaproteobacteria bacterium]|nr:septal ring lytic transglycosylase RlpA family protein [Gammaproteobacteria bacterium]